MLVVCWLFAGQWSASVLERVTAEGRAGQEGLNKLAFLVMGVMATLAALFKQGHRSAGVPVELAPVFPCTCCVVERHRSLVMPCGCFRCFCCCFAELGGVVRHLDVAVETVVFFFTSQRWPCIFVTTTGLSECSGDAERLVVMTCAGLFDAARALSRAAARHLYLKIDLLC